MKRFFKILLIDIIIISVLFGIFEAIAFHSEQKFRSKENTDIKIGYKLKYYDWDEHYPYIVKFNMRKPFGTQYKKEPIAVFGCSYAYGYKLKDEQSFGYKLSEYTKRPVYNRAYSGLSIQHSYTNLKEKIFIRKSLNPNMLSLFILTVIFQGVTAKKEIGL